MIMNTSFVWRRQLSPLPLCAGCAGDLPVTASDLCEPLVIESEIRRVFIAKVTAAPFQDWQNPAEWQSRLSDTLTTGDDYIRTLWVIGDKPAPSQNAKDVSNRRRVVINKTHTLNYTVDDAQPEIHEFMRALECGGQYRVWYETHGRRMYGGNAGVVASIDMNNVLDRGNDASQVYVGVVTWTAKFTEEQIDSPIFDFGSAQTAIYDSIIRFNVVTTPPEVADVSGTVTAIDPDQKFQFIALSPTVGTVQTMTITVGATQEASISFPSDYLGTAFKYTDKTAVVHFGNFVSGGVVF